VPELYSFDGRVLDIVPKVTNIVFVASLHVVNNIDNATKINRDSMFAMIQDTTTRFDVVIVDAAPPW
jgi:spermidine synthase